MAGDETEPHTARVPLIDLNGSPGERGFEHGSQLRSHIEHSIEVYGAIIGRPDSELAAFAETTRQVVRDYSPDLASEIEGIAEGAGVEPFRIYVLNARSELMASTFDGCTAVFADNGRLLGQTWDFAKLLEGQAVLMRITRPDGHRILTLTEAGIVGKIGMNTAGVGVCLNFLVGVGPQQGVPVHVLLRSVMESDGLSAARKVVDGSLAGQSGNMLISQAGRGGINVELAGAERSFEDIDASTYVHTNHHLRHGIDPGLMRANSAARFARAESMLAESPPGSLGGLRRILSDTSNATHPICAAYKPIAKDLPEMVLGTICTVLMDLSNREMQVRSGPHPNAPFASYSL